MSTTQSLPDQPNLEQLKKQARELQRELGGSLSDAQYQLALRYGFASWPKLKAHVELINGLSRTPDLAALTNPALPVTDIWSAATVASVDGIRTHIADAKNDGGPFGWAPLLYLCYARTGASEADVIAAATLLLDNGADPNAGFLWDGFNVPFTALTGVFGGGEYAQAVHPHADALARLLLERGAEPNDSQTLYNRQFNPNNDHLTLLFEFGLGTGDGGPWRKRMGDATESIEDMFRRQLDWAAVHNLRDRIALLLDNGVDVDLPLLDGQYTIDRATTCGHMELVGDLYARGAKQGPLEPAQVLTGFVLSVDRTNVDETLSIDPDAVSKAQAERPSLAVQAAARGSIDAIRYAVELGWDVNALGRSDMPIEIPWQTALHAAAERNDAVMVAALLQLGADPSIKDARFEATPAGWAEHFGHLELLTLLDP